MENRFTLMVGALVLGVAVIAGAQVSEDVPLQPQGQEPRQGQSQAEPTSSVARISLIKGDVSTQRGDSGDWAAAALNQPLVSSDKISTGVNSRTEVQLDGANILRLSDRTLAGIAGLSRNQIQIQIDRGLVDYTVFKGTEAAVEIDTVNVAVRPSQQQEGTYRVEVNAEGETQVIVRKGSAEIATPQGSTQVERGQMLIVRGQGDDVQYKVADAPSKDSWDSWNSDRDGTIRNAQSWGNTNRYYVGSEDLDTYGRWTTVPDYGPVWSPAVGPGWAPYRSGRWVWQPGWGWTWVSYEPWGWAPYHYGRWFVYNSSWVWWPGPVRTYPYYRPVYAPAYVSFFGFGGGVGVGVGFGFGSVGWLPVGPCDTFYPWYGRYGSRYNTVNVTNITNITNVTNIHNGYAPLRAGGAYSNLRLAATDPRVRGGISSVPTGQFGTGRSAPMAVNGEAFRGGRMIAGNLPIVPTREALSVSNRPAAASTVPRGGQRQNFFSQMKPGASPQPFDKGAAQVRQSIQRNGAGIGAAQTFPRGNIPTQNSLNTAAGAGRETVARPTPGVRTSVGGTQSNPSGISQPEKGSSSSQNQDWRHFGSGASPTRTPGQPATQNQGQGQMSTAQGTLSSPAGNNSVPRPPTADTSGWRHFSGSTPAQQNGAAGRQVNGSTPAMSNVPRSGNSARPDASSNDGGWRRFTPQSGANVQNAPDRVNTGGGMNVDRGSQMTRGESTGGRSMVQNSPASYSRPPLEMRQPIVTPRGSETRGSAPQASPSHGGGGGGGGNHGGGGGGGSHSGGGPHGGSGRR